MRTQKVTLLLTAAVSALLAAILLMSGPYIRALASMPEESGSETPPSGAVSGDRESYREIFDYVYRENWDLMWAYLSPGAQKDLSAEEYAALEEEIRAGAEKWEPEKYSSGAVAAAEEPDGGGEDAPMRAASQAAATTALTTLGSSVSIPSIGYNNHDVWQIRLNGSLAFCLDPTYPLRSGLTFTRTGTSSDANYRRSLQFVLDRPSSAESYEIAQVNAWAAATGYGGWSVRPYYEYYLSKTEGYGYAQLQGMSDQQIAQALIGTGRLGEITSAQAAYLDTSPYSGTAYVFELSGYQRLITLTPGTEPSGPSPSEPTQPQPDIPVLREVTVQGEYSAQAEIGVRVEKVSSLTGERLAGAVFEVWDGGECRGRITTDGSGTGSLSWQSPVTATASAVRTYVENWDDMSEQWQQENFYTYFHDYANAYNAAKAAAEEQARAEAEAGEAVCSVTLREVTVPEGYRVSDSAETAVEARSGESASVTVANTPIRGKVTVRKTDTEGNAIPGEAVFELEEWNGSAFVRSETYEIIRTGDGSYTVKGKTAGMEEGYLYYTEENRGQFRIREISAPLGYVPDPGPVLLTLERDGQEFAVSNDGSGYFVNAPQRVALTVVKRDAESGHPLDGAVFALYRDADCGDEAGRLAGEGNGQFRIENLPQGVYYLKELTAPYGYLANPEVMELSLFGDGTGSLTVEYEREVTNRPVTGVIEVEKHGEVPVGYEGGQFVWEEKGLPGARYEISVAEDILSPDGSKSVYTRDGITYAAGTVIAVLTTGEDGRASLENLPLGRYLVREVQAPEGYLIDRETVRSVELTCEGASRTSDAPEARGEFFNARPKVKMGVRKVYSAPDGSGDLPLAGAGFDLYCRRDILGDGGQVLAAAGTVIGHCVTGEDGYGEFAVDLPSGVYLPGEGEEGSEYYAKETDAPAGYLPDTETEYPLSFVWSGEEMEETVEAVAFSRNDYTKVEISKTDMTGETELPGARLRVSALQAVVWNGRRYEAGEVLEEFVSGDTPHRMNMLPPGRYSLTEEQAPEGYVLEREEILFTVEANGEIQRVTMRNRATLGYVIVKKIDAESGEPLSGAVFELRDGQGRVLQTLVTGADGTAQFTERPIAVYTDGLYREPVRYFLAEVQAPEGYLLSDEVKVIEFAWDGGAEAWIGSFIEFSDRKIPETPVVLTGDRSGIPLLAGMSGTSAALALTSGSALWRRMKSRIGGKKRKKEEKCRKS